MTVAAPDSMKFQVSSAPGWRRIIQQRNFRESGVIWRVSKAPEARSPIAWGASPRKAPEDRKSPEWAKEASGFHNRRRPCRGSELIDSPSWGSRPRAIRLNPSGVSEEQISARLPCAPEEFQIDRTPIP